VRPEDTVSMKNSNDTIGNRTTDLLVCSAVDTDRVYPKLSEKTLSRWQFVHRKTSHTWPVSNPDHRRGDSKARTYLEVWIPRK